MAAAGGVAGRLGDSRKPAEASGGLTFPERVVEGVERRWAWLLVFLMVLDLALLLDLGRGLTFFFDEWDFVTHDYGGGLHSLLVAHVGNIYVLPVAVYKVLFHLVGLNHYAVFRLVLIALHLYCAGLVFVLASRRVSRPAALMAMALILFLGAAWEDLLWPFEVGYLLSVAGGLSAWALLERDDRRGDVAALAGVTVAMASSSLGIPIMVGIAVELVWCRGWRRGWLVAIPAVLYVLWYLNYGESQVTESSLINTPGFAEDLAAAAFGGLIGRALEWGRPLALVGTVVLLARLASPRAVTPRLAGLIAAATSLWLVTAVARSTISAPETSRYIYLGAVLLVLIGVELLREISLTARATVLGCVVVAAAALTGFTVLHNGAMGLRATSKTVTAELGALELAARRAPAGYQPDGQRAPQILAGPYLHTVRAIGSSPADTPVQIAASDSASRAAADAVLMALESPSLAPASVHTPRTAATVTPLSLSEAEQVTRGGCVVLLAHPGRTLSGAFTLPARGVLLRDEGAAAVSLAAKRFGDGFNPIAPTLTAHDAAILSVPADASSIPWEFQVSSASTLSICGLSG
jgi:hypothetical protein